jgi:hypothetical protein
MGTLTTAAGPEATIVTGASSVAAAVSAKTVIASSVCLVELALDWLGAASLGWLATTDGDGVAIGAWLLVSPAGRVWADAASIEPPSVRADTDISVVR